MGKKDKQIEPDQDGVVHTGIYQRAVKAVRPAPPEDWKALQEHFDSWNNCTFAEHLKRIRQALRPLVDPFVKYVAERGEASVNDMAKPGKYGCLNIGDGVKMYRQIPEIEGSDPAANMARDAINALDEVDNIESSIGRHKELNSKESHDIFMDALRLGMIMERINVRPCEPLVLSATISRPGKVKGGQATKKLTAEQEELALEIISTKQSQNSRLSKTAACNRAATDLLTLHNIKVSGKVLSRLLPVDE